MIPSTMNRAERRKADRRVAAESKKFGAHLEAVTVPEESKEPHVVSVFRSRDLFVTVNLPPVGYEEAVHAHVTVSPISRADPDTLTWAQLQQAKNEAGFADFDAIEAFPVAADVTPNIDCRHLWVLRGLLPFAWRRVAV